MQKTPAPCGTGVSRFNCLSLCFRCDQVPEFASAQN